MRSAFLGACGVVAAVALTGSVAAQDKAKSPPKPKIAAKAPQLPEGTKVERDVPYVPDGGPRQQLDLYLPAESGRPLLVWVHGGGWQGGSKAGCPATYLLDHGFAVASINYRLTNAGPFPAQIHDCKAAIRWLRANAAKYGYDAKRIGVWGASAGGHLVALLGTSGDVSELEGDLGPKDQSSRVQAVCDWFGPTDFPNWSGAGQEPNDGPNGALTKLFGGRLPEKLAVAQAASPIRYVTPDDPPFLLVHGTRDPLVPLYQSEVLHNALTKAGVQSTLRVIQDGGHGGQGFTTTEVREAIRDFFKKYVYIN